jgi:hypothetical protein
MGEAFAHMKTGTRRWLAAPALLVAGGLALAGCSKPAGVDGNLTNDWPAMAEAKAAVPETGVCYDVEYDINWSGPFNPVDCAKTHHTETTYVGTFTGADASRSTPPLSGSTGRRTAFEGCMKNTSDYLGGDFHTASIFLGLVLPSSNAWKGGARWFRCDAVHYEDPDDDNEVTTGSVKDGLKGDAPLAFPCVNVVEDGTTYIGDNTPPVPCSGSHSAEFVGIYTAPDTPWITDSTKRSDLARKNCWEKVYAYVGARSLSQYIGLIWQNFSQDDWDLGDRSVRCWAYAYTPTHKFGESVKGIGARNPSTG